MVEITNKKPRISNKIKKDVFMYSFKWSEPDLKTIGQKQPTVIKKYRP